MTTNRKRKLETPPSKNQSIVSQLSYLRELLHGCSYYSETDISACLRTCGYNIERAAELLVTRQFSKINSPKKNETVAIADDDKLSKVPSPGEKKDNIETIEIDDADDRCSQQTQENPKPKAYYLLCQRWTVGYSTTKNGSIRYQEPISISTTSTPKGTIVRFKGRNAQGTLSTKLGHVIGPVMGYVTVTAKGFMDEDGIGMGQEIPLNVSVYVGLDLFEKGGAFELLQWAQYGDKLPIFKECEDDTNEDAEEEPPSWAGELYTPSSQLPQENDPISMNSKGIKLKCYQKQALYWMMHRESDVNDDQLRDQLELLAELCGQKNSQCVTGVECSVGPVLVSNEVECTALDGSRNPPILHPLWQCRYVLDNTTPYSFYVNEVLHTASISPPNPPKPCIGGLLCDSMGLGKTVMLIALICKEKEVRDVGSTLVVAPLSLLGQWEEEIESKSNLSCCAYYGDKKINKDVDVVLTTYGTVTSEYKSSSQSPLFQKFHRVILDEAHVIKNPNTGASKACCALDATKRWCVTGTPISNSLGDVYGLMKFLKHEPWCQASFWKKAITCARPEDGEMDVSLDRVRRLLKPILLRRTKDTLTSTGEPILKLPPIQAKTIKITLSPSERTFYNALLTKSQTIFDGFIRAGTASKSWFAIFSLLQRLRQACDHIALSVKLDDLVEDGVDLSLHDQFLSDLLESNHNDYSQKVVQSLTQSLLEDELQEECAICLEVIHKDNLAVTPCHHVFCKSCLVKVVTSTKKCPLCSNSITENKMICSQVKTETEPTARLKDLKEILNSCNGKSSSKMLAMFQEVDTIWHSDPASNILIFSQYLGMLDLIQSQMKMKNITYFRLDGSMSLAQRRKTLQSFNSHTQGSVLLASMKACGVGMNLTSASSVFILDPWWNDAQEDQCINRIHRIGQMAEVVRVRKFIVEDSVEEKIVGMQERKRGMASEVLSGGGGGGSCNPSLDELRDIFGR